MNSAGWKESPTRPEAADQHPPMTSPGYLNYIGSGLGPYSGRVCSDGFGGPTVEGPSGLC